MVIGVPQELVLAQQYLYRAFKAQTLCVWLKNRGRVLVLNAKPQQDYRHTMKVGKATSGHTRRTPGIASVAVGQ